MTLGGNTPKPTVRPAWVWDRELMLWCHWAIVYDQDGNRIYLPFIYHYSEIDFSQ